MKNQIVIKVARSVAKELGSDVLKDIEILLVESDEQLNQFGMGDKWNTAAAVLSICASLFTIYINCKQTKPNVSITMVMVETYEIAHKEILGGDLSPEDQEERKLILDKACHHLEGEIKANDKPI